MVTLLNTFFPGRPPLSWLSHKQKRTKHSDLPKAQLPLRFAQPGSVAFWKPTPTKLRIGALLVHFVVFRKLTSCYPLCNQRLVRQNQIQLDPVRGRRPRTSTSRTRSMVLMVTTLVMHLRHQSSQGPRPATLTGSHSLTSLCSNRLRCRSPTSQTTQGAGGRLKRNHFTPRLHRPTPPLKSRDRLTITVRPPFGIPKQPNPSS